MKELLLSICIPVYNKLDVFKETFESIYNASKLHANRLEIIISDDFSSDDYETYVSSIIKEYKEVTIRYNKNLKNLGMANNFIKCVELSKGEFCWILGSDDFIHPNSVSNILDKFLNHPKLEFIALRLSYLDLCDFYNLENGFSKIKEINYNSSDIRGKANFESQLILFDKLLLPEYGNIMLRSLPACIFKRELWLKHTFDSKNTSGFATNIDNTYPHCSVFAKNFLGKEVYYISEATIISGEGTRDWAGSKFYDGYLPIIFYKISLDVIDNYKKNGCNKSVVRVCKKNIATIIGDNWHLIKKYKKSGGLLKNSEYFNLKDTYKRVWLVSSFQKPVIKGCIKKIIKAIFR
ncbi:MAG: glycosyltransferase family 2 protein [Bacilli bacterium]|nr:glycosyltransferase family 2 protein [Bacilli bacterium]